MKKIGTLLLASMLVFSFNATSQDLSGALAKKMILRKN